MKIEIGTVVFWNSPFPSPPSQGGTCIDFGHVVEILLEGREAAALGDEGFAPEWKVAWAHGGDTWEMEEDIERYRQNFLDVEADLK